MGARPKGLQRVTGKVVERREEALEGAGLAGVDGG